MPSLLPTPAPIFNIRFVAADPVPPPRQTSASRSAAIRARSAAQSQSAPRNPASAFRIACSSSSGSPPGETHCSISPNTIPRHALQLPRIAQLPQHAVHLVRLRAHVFQEQQLALRLRLPLRAQQRNQDAQAAPVEHAARVPAFSVRNPSLAPTAYASPASAAVKLAKCTPSSR